MGWQLYFRPAFVIGTVFWDLKSIDLPVSPNLFLSDEIRCLCNFRGPEGSRDLDASINALVRLTSGQHVSASVVASSIQLLEAGVKQRLVDARKVCDALLSPAHMKHDNKAFWIQSFKVR